MRGKLAAGLVHRYSEVRRVGAQNPSHHQLEAGVRRLKLVALMLQLLDAGQYRARFGGILGKPGGKASGLEQHGLFARHLRQ
ncbi:hypothetical protein SDC9_211313 [bioreactor metagenome]|uniref:Uncharacterized protein n=1 Tax=bioreactor metagenome TaxID=1076179 RepID=A0A645JLF2_9ZZZZ